MKAHNPPIIVDVHLNCSIAQAWLALTDLKEMKQWYFGQLEDFQAQVGFKTGFEIRHEGRVFTHQWEVIEVVPFRNYTTSWKFLEYEGMSFATFEIVEKEGRLTVRVICVVNEDFPDNIPEFTRDSCYEGWKFFLQERLMNHFS
jgi:uncharacterized protein YndB with AHSA1/START domain